MDMFPVNSYALLKPPEGARGKLQMPKAGPYIVVGISVISTLYRTYLPTK